MYLRTYLPYACIFEYVCVYVRMCVFVCVCVCCVRKSPYVDKIHYNIIYVH